MNETDKELIACVAMEISDRQKVILKIINKEDEPLLKNLVASAIFLTAFMIEIAGYDLDKEIKDGLDKILNEEKEKE